MKSLTIKSKTIIAICLFVVLFATLVAVASVFDYQVSQILTKNALKPGEYLADDIFGVVGEAIGTSPIYILLGVCTAILCWFFAKNFKDKKWGIVLAVIFGLVGECALTAVALQGTLADLEEHAQVLIVEKADAFGQGRRLLPLRLHSQQQLVLTVEAFENFLHPSLEIVSGKQFHTYFLLPLSVFLPPVRNE